MRRIIVGLAVVVFAVVAVLFEARISPVDRAADEQEVSKLQSRGVFEGELTFSETLDGHFNTEVFVAGDGQNVSLTIFGIRNGSYVDVAPAMQGFLRNLSNVVSSVESVPLPGVGGRRFIVTFADGESGPRVSVFWDEGDLPSFWEATGPSLGHILAVEQAWLEGRCALRRPLHRPNG